MYFYALYLKQVMTFFWVRDMIITVHNSVRLDFFNSI